MCPRSRSTPACRSSRPPRHPPTRRHPGGVSYGRSPEPAESTSTNRRLRAPTDERAAHRRAAAHMTEPTTYRSRTGDEPEEVGRTRNWETSRELGAHGQGAHGRSPRHPTRWTSGTAPPSCQCFDAPTPMTAAERRALAGRTCIGVTGTTPPDLLPPPAGAERQVQQAPSSASGDAVPGAQENRRRTGDGRCTITDRSGTAPPQVTCHAGPQRAEDECLPRRATWETHSACPTGWAPLPCC